MANVKKQKGVVLITAMIMIVAVTAVAVSLMSSSSIDLKITNAAQERAEAETELIGEIHKLIVAEGTSANNRFTLKRQQMPDDGMDMSSSSTPSHMTNTLKNLNKGEMELHCPRQFAYTDGLTCNLTEMESTITYGSKNKHTITVVIGIGQEIISHNEGN
ncbi:pilus assembly protein PilX [Pseudoalteromonas phenolica]|uniref:Pilus assembly protein PilX n=1 Tax=Pseudoalteromonas phenolica TaxID=161398 RepID=A0A5R9PXX4_9GAMM|nr:pilus assembly protein PilX [Pseudoalteromonas phenolica]TLX45760.1 pilus assembly protein PilX [Pseudoalteromonas phenolica]